MDGMDYDPMVMDGEPEQPQVKISAVRSQGIVCVMISLSLIVFGV